MNALAANNQTGLIDAFGRGWNRFWFTPADPRPACVLRIAVGLMAMLHFAGLGLGLDRWYASDGLLPPAAVANLLELTGQEAVGRYTYLNLLQDGAQLRVVRGAAIVAAALFAAGLFTRISGVLALVSLLAFVHRVPQVAGLAEPILAFLLAYLCIAPAGACLSLDGVLHGWRAKKKDAAAPAADPRQPSVAANIGLRLIQVHLAMFCLMMGLSKLYGDAWWFGNAIWILLAQTESRPLNLTGLRQGGQWGEYLINAWTLGTVYFELAFPVLVWNRTARPWLVTLGLVVWTALVLATGQLLLGLTLIVASGAFLPPECFSWGTRGRGDAIT
jgi:hypothetical protein